MGRTEKLFGRLGRDDWVLKKLEEQPKLLFVEACSVLEKHEVSGECQEVDRKGHSAMEFKHSGGVTVAVNEVASSGVAKGQIRDGRKGSVAFV